MDKKISALTSKTTPANADSWPIHDSAGSATKRVTGTNLKAFLKTYFDTIYGTSVVDEIPTGSGVTRTIANSPIDSTLTVYDGAVRLHITTDYTVSDKTITFVVSPDFPYVDYRY